MSVVSAIGYVILGCFVGSAILGIYLIVAFRKPEGLRPFIENALATARKNPHDEHFGAKIFVDGICPACGLDIRTRAASSAPIFALPPLVSGLFLSLVSTPDRARAIGEILTPEQRERAEAIAALVAEHGTSP